MINCNYSNDRLDENEWERIQTQCVKQKHIGPNDNLQTIINTDTQTLANAGITFNQLEDLFVTFKLLAKKHKSSFSHYPDIIKKYFDDKSDNFFKLNKSGWCCWCMSYHQFEMFGSKYFVIRYTWGGAETCPFQSVEDKKYHGYEYGSHDWLIWNLDSSKFMHIGDLLFHQITAHQFFQAPGSAYRVEPAKLIELFGLKPGVEYKVPIKEVKYARMQCSLTDSPVYTTPTYNCEIKETLVTTPNYALSKIIEQTKEKYYLELFNENIKGPIVFDNICFHAFNKYNMYDLEPEVVKELA